MALKYRFNLKDIKLEDFKVYLVAMFKGILPKKKIKPCKTIIDQSPLLNKKALDLILWCKNYYHHPVGKTYAAAIPK